MLSITMLHNNLLDLDLCQHCFDDDVLESELALFFGAIDPSSPHCCEDAINEITELIESVCMEAEERQVERRKQARAQIERVIQEAQRAREERAIVIPQQKAEKRKREPLAPWQKEILEQFLAERIHDPYPTDEEKDMLCAKTQRTRKQIEDWFTNARKRKIPRGKFTVKPPHQRGREEMLKRLESVTIADASAPPTEPKDEEHPPILLSDTSQPAIIEEHVEELTRN